jgi:hypothetical protein
MDYFFDVFENFDPLEPRESADLLLPLILLFFDRFELLRILPY